VDIGAETMLVDSNVLVYAYDRSDAKKHAAAEQLLKRLWVERSAVVSMQNLAEFYHIITAKIEKPLPPETAKQIVTDLIAGFEVLRYSEKTIVSAIGNQAIYGAPFWDALIVATMEENSVGAIVTENEKDFAKAKWLKVINPFK